MKVFIILKLIRKEAFPVGYLYPSSVNRDNLQGIDQRACLASDLTPKQTQRY